MLVLPASTSIDIESKLINQPCNPPSTNKFNPTEEDEEDFNDRWVFAADSASLLEEVESDKRASSSD